MIADWIFRWGIRVKAAATRNARLAVPSWNINDASAVNTRCVLLGIANCILKTPDRDSHEDLV